MEFWAALLGALVGGFAAAAGSVLVNRRELVRSARVRLHDELLPELEESVDQSRDEFRKQLEASRRASVLAGDGALECVKSIETAHEVFDWAAGDLVPGAFNSRTGRYEGESGREEYSKARLELLVEIRVLQDWIEDKIL